MLARPLLPAALLAAATASGGPSRPAAAPQPSAVAIVGGTIHVAPGAAPIRDGVLVVDGGRIAAVGPRASTSVPVGARVVDARGGTVLAAFWNAHVHLIGPQWSGIDTMAAPRAQALLRDAFGRFGFAHVVDIGSFDAAQPLRRRLEAGELFGPEVLTTLAPFVPRDGTPVYLPGMRLPELHDAARARDSVRARVAQGADAIKLFVVPITAREPFPVMAPEIVAAVADEAHRAGRLVVAHPTDLTGVRVAVRNGVDVLAHTVPRAGPIPDSLLGAMRRRDVALVPTLMLCEVDYGRDTTGMGRFVRTAQAQLRAYAARGGRVLFGTDVGYVAEQDPTREYELMAGAGLDFAAILASLTTGPARTFGRAERTGRLAPGLDADVVVVDGDPTRDVRALARVRLTMRRGRVLYEARDAASPAPDGIEVAVPVPPAPVRMGAADRLAYELHVTNLGDVPVMLAGVEVRDAGAGRALASITGDALPPLLGRPGPGAAGQRATRVEPGSRAVLYLDVATGVAPRRLAHRLTFARDDAGAGRFHVDVAPVAVDTTPLPVLGPPLRGGPWAAVYDPAMGRGHRRVLYALDGRARIPGRFAVDFFRVDARGRFGAGSPDRLAEFHGYGADVLAVADGVVAAAHDGVPEPERASAAPRVRAADAAGNFVAIDLGGGRYAFYEHLRPGLRVRPGDRVRRGQVIGALGLTGQATAPHLHFHVADAPAPLAAEGRPWRLDGWELLGAYPSIERVGGEPWAAASPPTRPAPSLPAPNVVVRFPGP